MRTIDLGRHEAEEMIDAVRRRLAEGDSPAAVEEMMRVVWGIPPLEACGGEAHSNPHIDSCGACSPRWGSVGPRVRILTKNRR